jgi:hypothetical protein
VAVFLTGAGFAFWLVGDFFIKEIHGIGKIFFF